MPVLQKGLESASSSNIRPREKSSPAETPPSNKTRQAESFQQDAGCYNNPASHRSKRLCAYSLSPQQTAPK
eukprot:2910467-Amphidinium_carterae.2